MRRATGSGGATVGDHYAAAARSRKRPAPQAPEIPPAALPAWNAFAQLHAARGSSGFGPQPIGWVEIDAFCRLTRPGLAAWEIEAIRALDDAWLTSRAEDAAPRPRKADDGR